MQCGFGEFLKQKRCEKNLTQKDLAQMLFVSESAVSKWEKNVAHPDITLLPKLSSILDVSEHELITASIDNNARIEKAQAKKWKTLSLSWNLFFYICYGLALITCFTVNLAVNKTLDWFWIVFCSLLLSFTFTTLPQFIKKHKLIFLPLSMFLSLCLLLGVCAIYTKGEWFFIPVVSVLLALIIIFTPIYISKYKIFAKIRKFNDFISLAVEFIFLNLLLIVIDLYTVSNWYINLALPICLSIYLIINLLISVRFLKLNKLIKTSIILFMINILYCLTPLCVKSNNPDLQKEFDSLNIFSANFTNWSSELAIERNIHLIVFLTILLTSIMFFIFGLIKQIKKE